VRAGANAVATTQFDELNEAQRVAVESGISDGTPRGPLLVIAGAGSGKTRTLAHRVAHLLAHGADPRRLLLLTFSRRAAAEMIRRVRRVERRAAEAERAQGRPVQATAGAAPLPWAGTFHSIANRLLRLHAESVGLDPGFTVLDREDAAGLIDVLREERGLAAGTARFPRKGTCLAIYSHTVNAGAPLETTLAEAFPWCEGFSQELRGLFAAYVAAKQARNVLDYDDLLLYWFHLLGEPELAVRVRGRFDHVLVDEYQDTNALQAKILLRLVPDGAGLTVVGDDAQSIYSFRAATVRNILDFPGSFEPPARVVTLEENYRSTGTILAACNAVIALAAERFSKNLHSRRASRERPELVSVEDEPAQVDYVVGRVLAHREAGIPLQRQAVLFRAAHHSDALEVELGRRNIPFVKYGGLRFLEAAHVKDVLCVLRWVENPRDDLAAFRVLQLLPGVGPGTARRALAELAGTPGLGALRRFRPPPSAAEAWPPLCALLEELRDAGTAWAGQLAMVRRWYRPHLERLYDAVRARESDLDQLEQLSAGYGSRERFLSELILDPPAASSDRARDPHLDEEFLVLSTIHSAKGQEWDAVFVLNVVDGAIPSDMAVGRPEQVEEERRLLYVAMSRARDHLHLVQPLRFAVRQQPRYGDSHVYAPRSRFLPDSLLDCFARRAHGGGAGDGPEPGGGAGSAVRIDVASRLRAAWHGPTGTPPGGR
jgi:DNA helicase-2/ATP-dependent DNA helicase PcrA